MSNNDDNMSDNNTENKPEPNVEAPIENKPNRSRDRKTFIENDGGLSNKNKKSPKYNLYFIYAIGLILMLFAAKQFLSPPYKEIMEGQFFKELLPSGDVDRIVVKHSKVEVFIKKDSIAKKEKYKELRANKFTADASAPAYIFEIGSLEVFSKALDAAQKDKPLQEQLSVGYEEPHDFTEMLITFFPFLLLGALIWFFFLNKGAAGGGGGGPAGIFNIGRSRAQLFDKEDKITTTFADVAGLSEAKEEVMEIVDFLKNPQKYTKLGGKIPKGALLIGPPGTGKTLLAKAMAGEAKVPFFSISGSDFVEMFVGVGASRVRDLFRQAKEKSPCIIFIDEIDAIGRARGRGAMQNNDERENTLNQLLVEMDGFGTDTAVILLAATNRPDVLDSALMRPGRFDRQISVDKPDIKGREEIFKVHLKNKKLGSDVSAEKLATQTPGFAGADIANVCNEAALIAARKNKEQIEMKDFQDAVDRSIGGLEKKNKIISPEEKRIVAYHEAGHAVCGWFLEHADPLVKVTIVPRGIAALGYAQYLPKEQYLYTTEQLTDTMCMTLGGRAAEELTFGRISTGAQSDLEHITKLSYNMITIYGMSAKVGNISFYDPQNEYGFTKPYSEHTAQMIDEEVRKIIQDAYIRTKNLLTDKHVELEKLAQALLEKEVLFKHDLEEIIGPRPYDKKVEPETVLNTASAENTDAPVINDATTPTVN